MSATNTNNYFCSRLSMCSCFRLTHKSEFVSSYRSQHFVTRKFFFYAQECEVKITNESNNFFLAREKEKEKSYQDTKLIGRVQVVYLSSTLFV